MVQEFVLFVGDIIRSCLQEGQHEHGLVVCNQKNAPSPSPRGKAKQAEADDLAESPGKEVNMLQAHIPEKPKV